MDQLKPRIEQVLSSPDYSAHNLVEALGPIDEYTQNPEFVRNLEDIVKIITTDRDGSGDFSFNDLNILCHDWVSVANLSSICVTALVSIPDLHYQYEYGVTELLIYKIFIYILLVLIPQETGKEFTDDERRAIYYFCNQTYIILCSTKVIKNLFTKIGKLLKSTGLCCCSKDTTDIVDEQLTKDKYDLTVNLTNASRNVKSINHQFAQ